MTLLSSRTPERSAPTLVAADHPPHLATWPDLAYPKRKETGKPKEEERKRLKRESKKEELGEIFEYEGKRRRRTKVEGEDLLSKGTEGSSQLLRALDES